MKTYVAKKGHVEHRWFLVDAKGRSLGRLATQIALLLRGKGKPQFTPNTDCGDHVVVINAAQVRLTGSKMENKVAYRHSGYQGGLRTINYGRVLQGKKPERVVQMAVRGMLPKTKLARSNFSKLHVYADDKHPHAAQAPQALSK